MKCPLLVMGQLANSIPAVGSNSDCTKDCAWWQEDDEVCWIVQIGLALSSIAGDLILVKNDIEKLAGRSFN